MTTIGHATAEIPAHGVILLYHHVDSDTPAITSVKPSDFTDQMQHLEQQHFNVWPLPKLVTTIQNQLPVPDKVVAITFDDNYRSVYREAFPLLKKRGWPFTIFVSTDAVDQGINMQSSWQQIREMAAEGATIANHSASHSHLLQRLPGEDNQHWRQRISADIEKAQQRIKQETGQQHKLFAYPYGEFNQELSQLVQELGYIAIGQQSGAFGQLHNGLAIPRFPVAGDYSKLDDFALKIRTLPLPVISTTAADNPLDFNSAMPTLQLTFANADETPSHINYRPLQCFGTGQGQLSLQWLSEKNVVITPAKGLPVGRSRFNCTLASGFESEGISRYYWFSYPWIREDAQGRLPD